MGDRNGEGRTRIGRAVQLIGLLMGLALGLWPGAACNRLTILQITVGESSSPFEELRVSLLRTQSGLVEQAAYEATGPGTLNAYLPAEVAGGLDVQVDALDEAGRVVARGTGHVELAGGQLNALAVDLIGAAPPTVLFSNSGTEQATAVASDGTTVYWATTVEGGPGHLYAAAIDGSDQTRLPTPTRVEIGLLAYRDDALVYSDVGSTPGIKRFSLSTLTETLLTEDNRGIRALALGPTRVFWTADDGDEGGAVKAVDLDGSAPVTTLVAQPGDTPAGLVVDESEQNLYWVTRLQACDAAVCGGTGTLWSADLEVQKPSATGLERNLDLPSSIGLVGDVLYWLNEGSTPGTGSLETRPILESGRRAEVALDQMGPAGLNADETGVYWATSGDDPGGVEGLVQVFDPRTATVSTLARGQQRAGQLALDRAGVYWISDVGVVRALKCTGVTSLCGPSCVDLQTDRGHCGACARICEEGYCSFGRCDTTPVDEAVAPVCPEGMVGLPGGSFRQAELGAQTVEPFCLDRTEVTTSAYVAGGGDLTDVECGEFPNYRNGRIIAGREMHPMNCVDSSQAEAFCRSQSPAGRLPTEVEWEWAARSANLGRRYPWGDEAPGAGDLPEHLCWSGGPVSTRSRTCEVGSYPAGDSAEGIQDLAGNVLEWTSSPHEGGPDLICRGGSWLDYGASFVHAGRRFVRDSSDRSGSLGFRCARTP